MMKYNKLFALLTMRDMKKSDLVTLKIISSPTLAKLSKGESITTTVLCQLCDFLHCQPGDIMEYIPDDTTNEKLDSDNLEKPDSTENNNPINHIPEITKIPEVPEIVKIVDAPSENNLTSKSNDYDFLDKLNRNWW